MIVLLIKNLDSTYIHHRFSIRVKKMVDSVDKYTKNYIESIHEKKIKAFSYAYISEDLVYFLI